MTRFFTATAIAALVSTSAMALTEREESAIKRYAPTADLSIYSDETIATVMNVISSGDSHSATAAQVRSLLMMDDPERLAVFTTSQVAALDDYVGAERLATMTRAEKRLALNYVNSGESRATIMAQIDGLLSEDSAAFEGNDATIGETSLIRSYAPELEVEALSQQELELVLLTINSTDAEGTIPRKIDALLES